MLTMGVGSVMIISLVRLKTINQFTRAVNPTSSSPLNIPPRLPPVTRLC
jgi:hypothetical protein